MTPANLSEAKLQHKQTAAMKVYILGLNYKSMQGFRKGNIVIFLCIDIFLQPQLRCHGLVVFGAQTALNYNPPTIFDQTRPRCSVKKPFAFD